MKVPWSALELAVGALKNDASNIRVQNDQYERYGDRSQADGSFECRYFREICQGA